MMKWLWMLCPPGLCRPSVRAKLPNGTLPIARSKLPSGARVSAKDSLAMSASGYSLAAIEAVTGSSSTPVTRAPPGAKPMKFPLPHPASRTRPPAKPSCCTPVQMAWTRAASV